MTVAPSRVPAGAASLRGMTPDDHAWVGETGRVLFEELGDYAWILGQWLPRPGVHGWVVEQDGARVGFSILAFYSEAEVPGGPVVPVADLLALGVVPAAQRQGWGGRLLAHAIAAAERVASAHGVDRLRLTVAVDNVGARRLYAAAGFVDAGAAAAYASGRAALRMVRPF